MGKTFKLSESQLIEIVKRIINEQETMPRPKDGNQLNRTPGQKMQSAVPVDYAILDGRKLDGSLFGNAVSRIDKNSTPYRQSLESFKKLAAEVREKNLGNIVVNIEGGASAVGSAQGYDNNKLAQVRAQNFVNTIKQDIPNAPFIFRVTGRVGNATIKNSNEAKAEQYVKINVPEIRKPNWGQGGEVGRDNTAIRQGPVMSGNQQKDGKRPYMVLKVFYDATTGDNITNTQTLFNEFVQFGRKKNMGVYDVTQNARNCKL
jgi:hypothetical protein